MKKLMINSSGDSGCLNPYVSWLPVTGVIKRGWKIPELNGGFDGKFIYKSWIFQPPAPSRHFESYRTKSEIDHSSV